MPSFLALLILVAAPTYTLDKKQSELVVKTSKAGFAAALAHNHVIRATELEGSIGWDPAAPEAASVKVTVQTAALVVDDPAMRKKHGEPSELSAGDRKKITDAMLDSGQLDVRKFPTISFSSTALQKDAKGWLLSGNLTLHGVTKAVKLPVTIDVKGTALTADGTLRLRTSDYGIKPYSAALGAIKNRDEVELVLHLVGAR